MTKDNTAREERPRDLRLLAAGNRKMKPEALDAVIHERTRLSIVSALAVNDTLSFTELKELLSLSDGNLSAHAQKLEGAGYIRCKKSFKGRTPLTEYRLTDKGRKTLEGYLNHMEALINAVQKK